MTRATISLDDLDGSNGFRLKFAGDKAAFALVKPAGDLNGDGLADLAIDGDEVFVVFGLEGRLDAVVEIGALDGKNGFLLDDQDYFPLTTSAVGDFDGDSIDDLLTLTFEVIPNVISDDPFIEEGFFADVSVFKIPGRAGSFPVSVDPISQTEIITTDSSLVFESQFFLEFPVAGVGDMNGDGLGDFVVGTPSIGDGLGGAFVVFGRSGGGVPLQSAWLDGANGFRLLPEAGAAAGPGLGQVVSAAGDLNGDGLADLVLSAPRFDPDNADELRPGRSYVVFGSRERFPAAVDLSKLDGKNGFVFDGKEGATESGSFLTKAGDINGDGVDDLAIGVLGQAETYYLFGRKDGFAPRYNAFFETLFSGFPVDSSDGFQLSGARTVVGAGDVDGDGVDDILVGPTLTLGGEWRVHLLYGTTDGSRIKPQLVTDGFGSTDIFPDGRNGFSIDVGRFPSLLVADIDFAGPGDVNGDGYDDIVITTPVTANGQGGVHVILGAPRVSQSVTVRAGGEGGPGDAPAFKLLVNGLEVAQQTIIDPQSRADRLANGVNMRDYVFQLEPGLDPQDVSVVYFNDRIRNGVDRNLFVDSVTFGGKTYQSEEDGFFSPANPGPGRAGPRESLFWNGQLAFESEPPAPLTLRVYAGGTDGPDVFSGSEVAFVIQPKFSVSVDGASLGSRVVSGSQSLAEFRQNGPIYEAFDFRLADASVDKVAISFANDQRGGAYDLNLFIDRIEIIDSNGVAEVFQSEVDGVYTRATGQVIGPSERMFWNGQLVFDDLGVAV